jgi:hypothetical protein
VAKIGKNWLTIDRFSNFFRLISRFSSRGTHSNSFRTITFLVNIFGQFLPILATFYEVTRLKILSVTNPRAMNLADFIWLDNWNIFLSLISFIWLSMEHFFCYIQGLWNTFLFHTWQWNTFLFHTRLWNTFLFHIHILHDHGTLFCSIWLKM